MKSFPAPDRVESPCIQVCVLDVVGVCVGCGRSVDEIAAWTTMSSAQQHRVCIKAAERRRQATVTGQRG